MGTIFDTSPSVRFISHRGFTPLAPENSLPAFQYAGQLCQWAIETDVRVARDGTLVCVHDADTAGMFGRAGRIEEMTWPELSEMRMCRGSRLHCFEEDQLRLPLFSEYLSVCKAYGCVPFIELKTPQADRVLRAVREAGYPDEAVIISAIPPDWLLETRRYSKTVFIHWIFAEAERMEAFSAAGNAGISLDIPDAFACEKQRIDQAHALGLKICLRAGDSVESVRRMSELALDYIPTNCMHPPLLRPRGE